MRPLVTPRDSGGTGPEGSAGIAGPSSPGSNEAPRGDRPVRQSAVRAVLTLAATLWPALAWAHVEKGRAEGFLAGVHHPVSGLDHVLAMVSVGLWGAQLGAPAVWLLPVTFPMVMAFGGMLGLMGVPLPGVEVGIACSGILLGLAVLAEWRPPLWAAAVIVGFFAVFHGHAHGSELPPGASGLLYSIGFVAATGTLHAIGIGVGAIHRWGWGRVALRAAGAFVASAGAYFLWRAFA
jgi:urease accessory protein